MLLQNDWGGARFCSSDGTNGPWVMTNPRRLIGMEGVGSKECVAIAQFTLNMPHTSLWRGGDKVLGIDSIEEGTVVATFIDGRYPSHQHNNHVAIYISQGENERGKYIYVIDQWKGVNPHYRPIYAKEGLIDPSNNANVFSVVFTLPAPPQVSNHKRRR